MKNTPTVELSVDDIYFQDHTFTYRWNYYKRNDEETYSAKIKEAEENLANNDPTSEYFGEVDKRYDLTLTYVRSHSWETTFAYNRSIQYLHSFKDEAGNIFVWKTGTSLYNIEENSTVTIKGTVKEHSEYRGIKQTVLTRCKVL